MKQRSLSPHELIAAEINRDSQFCCDVSLIFSHSLDSNTPDPSLLLENENRDSWGYEGGSLSCPEVSQLSPQSSMEGFTVVISHIIIYHPSFLLWEASSRIYFLLHRDHLPLLDCLFFKGHWISQPLTVAATTKFAVSRQYQV